MSIKNVRGRRGRRPRIHIRGSCLAQVTSEAVYGVGKWHGVLLNAHDSKGLHSKQDRKKLMQLNK